MYLNVNESCGKKRIPDFRRSFLFDTQRSEFELIRPDSTTNSDPSHPGQGSSSAPARRLLY